MIGLILEQTVGFLQDKLGLDSQFISLQIGGNPTATSPAIFMGVYDEGITNDARPDAQFIREVINVTVGCWVRGGSLPPDRQGQHMGWTKRYHIGGRPSLDKVCRDVLQLLAGETGPQGGPRWQLVKRINDVIDATPGTYGDCIVQPLRYVNMGSLERYSPPWMHNSESAGHNLFFGRRVRFRGMERTQAMEHAR